MSVKSHRSLRLGAVLGPLLIGLIVFGLGVVSAVAEAPSRPGLNAAGTQGSPFSPLQRG